MHAQVSVTNAVFATATAATSGDAKSKPAAPTPVAAPSRVSSDIRADVLSSFMTLPANELVNKPMHVLTGLWSDITNKQLSSDVMEKKTIDTLRKVEGVIQSYQTKTVRLMVSVMFAVKESCFLEPKLPKRTASKLLDLRRQTVEDESARLAEPGGQAAPKLINPPVSGLVNPRLHVWTFSSQLALSDPKSIEEMVWRVADINGAVGLFPELSA